MADDRLPCCRSESIDATSSDNVMSRSPAISFSPFQNASSRLTLVLCPAITIERLTTGDFIGGPLFQSGAGRGRGWPWLAAQLRAFGHVSAGRKPDDWSEQSDHASAVSLACGRSED